MYLHSKHILRALLGLLLSSWLPLSAAANLEVAGLAVYTDTARDIYVAGLLTPGGTPPVVGQINPPAAMQYRIATRRISDRGLSGTILLQAEVGAGQRAPEHVVDGLEQLKQRLKGALRSGDQFEIALSDAGNTVFSLNHVELLTVSGGAMFEFLLHGWIGDSASALMRDSLLSGKLDDAVMLRYESLIPLQERNQLAASWVAEGAPREEPVVAAVAAVPVAEADADTVAEEAPKPAAAQVEPEAVAQLDFPLAAETEAAEAAAEAEIAEAALVAAAVLPETAPASEQLAMLEPVSVVTSPMSEQEVWVAGLDDREYQQYLNEYISGVMIEVFRSVQYPKRAIKRKWQGQVEILAQVDDSGQLMDIAVEASSGRDILDDAAIAAVEKAAPFPELTPVARAEFLADEGANSYYMLIPVKFQLN